MRLENGNRSRGERREGGGAGQEESGVATRGIVLLGSSGAN